MVNRRQFAKSMTAAGMLTALRPVSLFAAEKRGTLPMWKEGELQVHFLYAGSSESVFAIMPDGTTMLVDVGDYDVGGDWSKRNPVATLGGRGPGKFTADYIKKVNPFGNKVDYWLLTHWHADHGGCETSYSAREERDGEVWFKSGLAELIDDITFSRGLDRCWPNRNDPFECKDTSVRQFAHIARTYRYLERHQGLKIEKFRVGADDQIRLLKNPNAFPKFKVLNICGNGVIRTRDGDTRNLYADFVPRNDSDVWRRENGLSCGFIMSYGGFRLYSAGDFQDFWKRPDGSTFQTEDALAAEVGRVDVAKTNHHASDSMTRALIKALSARVWVTSSVSGYSDWPTTIKRLTDRSIYPDERLICSTYYHFDAVRDLACESLQPNHVVISVPREATTYKVFNLKGDDSLSVLNKREFTVG